MVDQSWFEEQYDDIERKKEGHVTSAFSIDWDKWEIGEKTTYVKLGVHLGNKRKPIFNKKKKWIDTKPIKVNELEDTEIKLRVEIKRLKERKQTKRKIKEELERREMQAKKEEQEKHGNQTGGNTTNNDSTYLERLNNDKSSSHRPDEKRLDETFHKKEEETPTPIRNRKSQGPVLYIPKSKRGKPP